MHHDGGRLPRSGPSCLVRAVRVGSLCKSTCHDLLQSSMSAHTVRIMTHTTSSQQLSGAVVRELRLERGWSHRDMERRSRALGYRVGHSTFSKIERGQQPRVRTEWVIAKLFGFSVHQLRTLTVERIRQRADA